MAKNEGMEHGLFGKLEPGPLTEFADWKEIARLVYQNSKKHITMYRSIISFDEETANELMLKDQKAWQRYIENHIMTIAEKNHIKREHLQWACALHKEKKHPHIHVVFWDTSSRVKNPYTHPAIPNAIRKQMIRDTFALKIKEFGQQKNLAVENMRRISDELVDEFECHIRRQGKGNPWWQWRGYEREEKFEESMELDDVVLNEIANRVFQIKAILPLKGRIAYQLLPPEVKGEVDSLVEFLLEHNLTLKTLKADYIDSKIKMSSLYSADTEHLDKIKAQFGKEADKIIANRILGMVKSLNRLEAEKKSEKYLKSRRTFFAEQLVMEILDMLNSIVGTNGAELEDWNKENSGELSKAAQKELYLKYQDKGYEH